MRTAAVALLGILAVAPAATTTNAAAAATPDPVASACPTLGPSPTTPTPTPAPTPTLSPGSLAALCAQKLATESVRKQLGEQLAAGLEAEANLNKSLLENSSQQSTLRDRTRQSQAEIERLNAEVARLTDSVNALTLKVKAEERHLGSVARSVYFSPDSLLLRIVQAGSLRQMLVSAAEMAALSTRAQAIRRRLSDDRAQITAQRTEASAALDRQAALRAQLDADLAALAQLRIQQEDSERQLSAKLSAVRVELSRLDAQDVPLARRIAAELQTQQQALIVAATQEAWAQLAIWLRSNQVDGGAGAGRPGPYPFGWPLPGAVITQGFGPSDLVFEPPFAGFTHFHEGLDLALPEGTPVLAAQDGAVAVVGSSAVGYGNYVVLAHRDGTATLYGHLARSLVSPGDKLLQGQPLGLEGSTGNSTGPHLHFEIRVDGKPVDPLGLLPPRMPHQP